MRLVGYIRVSTDRQAEEGLGLSIQEQAIRSWARKEGHRLVALARDEGVSGSNGLETRIGLADAFDLLRDGKAEGLVVYRLDRLARDLVLQEQLLAEMWRIGVEVFSTSASEGAYLSDDPADPSRKLIRQVLGAVSEYERAMVRLRLEAGRRRKKENGGFAYGAPPFGYRAVDGALIPDEHEQSAIRRITELRGDGASLSDIAAVLQDENFRPRRSSRWHARCVGRIVARLSSANEMVSA